MKLEGSLDAFSLPDIFQLLSFTKKTGGLHLVSAAADGADSRDGVVFFATGQVTGASADSSRQPLARRLVGSGAVDDEALAAAVAAVSAGEGLGVVRALRDAGAVDADLLRQAATDQTVDAVFDLLRWREGDFAFVLDEANPDDVGVSLSVESVLADTEARRSSWESVSQVVPSPSTVLAMPVVLTADPSVTRDEWALLSLVDGRRTVAELVDLTGSGQYAVVSTLAALVQRGLLEVRGDADGDHVSVVLRRQALLAPLEAFAPAVTAPDRAQDVPAETPEVEQVSRSDQDDQPAAQTAPPPEPDEEPQQGEPELVTASAGPDGVGMLGGAHVPGDVVPPRPEPFLPRRQVDFDDAGAPAVRPVHVQSGSGSHGGSVGDVVGATATAPNPDVQSVIERDPSINRSLMLRLIAGVRGL